MYVNVLRRSRTFFAYVFVLGVTVWGLIGPYAAPISATTGINKQINFQGRLLNAQGATVPDGYYNIQFKIYQDGDGQSVGNTTGSPAGVLKWTESHLNNNTQGVLVKNGYMSVQLGSVTPFGTSVDWNQDTIWLSMNIGNTNLTCTPFTSCVPDGEMVPMKRLSATPYALNAGQLGGLASSQFVQIGQGVQGDATSNSSIFINKTSTGNLLELQNGGNGAFLIDNSGNAVFGNAANHTVSVSAASAGVTGRTLTVSAGDAGTGATVNGGDLLLQGGAASGTGTSGSVIVRSNATNTTGAFQVQRANNNVAFNVDTTNNSVQVASLLDTTTATTLNIGTTNATDIDLEKNTEVTGSNTLTVGTGLTSLGGGLSVTAGAVDITSSIALKKGTDFSTNGTTNNANFGEASLIRLTGSSTQIITGIANGRDGEVLTIMNAAGQEAGVYNNNSGSSAANRIITGTGFDVALPAGASLTMVYDGGASLWRITSGVASTGGSGVNAIGAINSQTKHANGAVIVGTTLYLQTADASSVGLVSTGAQTMAGAKTFNSLLTGSAGATFSGGALTMTGNAASSLTTSSGALTLTSAAAATWSTAAGDLTLQAGSGQVSLGTSTGLTSTGALTVTGGSSLALRSTGTNTVTIDTGGAAGVNIGTVNADAVSISRTGQTTTINGALAVTQASDFTQSAAFKKGTDFSTTGTSNNVSFANASLIRLTGASAQTITGIANGRDGYVLTIVNAAGQAATIANNSGSSTAANRITTGTGADLVIPAGASLSLVYDSTASLWRVTGGAAATGGYIQNQNTAQQPSSTFWISGNGRIDGSVLTPTVDALPSGTLSVGTSNATAINIGKSGITTTNAGAMTVTELFTGNAGATINGGAIGLTGNAASSFTTSSGALTLTSAAAATWSTAAGNLTLQAGSGTVTLGTSTNLTSTGALTVTGGSTLSLTSTGVNNTSIDTGGGAAITVGTVNATSVSISRAGQTTTVNGALAVTQASDFTQSVALKKGTDFSTTGTSNNVALANASLIRLTGASAQTITGIASGRDGYLLTIVNAAAQAATIANNSGSSTAANRIVTGTGSDITLPAGASMTLVYDSTASLWRVSSGTVAATGGYIQNQNSAQQASSNFWISGTGRADNGFTGPSLDVASAGTLTIGGSLATIVQIGNTSLNTGTQAINIGTNNTAGGTTNVTIGAGATATGGTTALQSKDNTTFTTNGVLRGTFDTSNNLYLGNGTTAAAPNDFTVTATGSATAGTAGAKLTLQGGAGASATTGGVGGGVTIAGGNAAGSGNNAGGTVILQGGNKTNTGAAGTVLVKNSADSATAFHVQNAAGNATAMAVDTTNLRVGIGTNAPAVSLHVSANTSAINALPVRIQQSGTGDTGVEFNQPSQQFYMGIDSTDNKFKISSAQAGATTGTIGNTSSAGTVDSGNRNTLEATSFVAGATGTINSINAFVGGPNLAATPYAQAAIYSNNAGAPGTRLGYGTANTLLTLNAWNTLPISSVSVTSGTTYWLVYNTNGTADTQNNLKFIAGSANQTQWATSQNYGTWPSSWPGTSSGSATQLSMYATILVGQNADNFAASLFQMSGTGQTIFQNSTDAVNAFQIQNAAGTALVGVDTTNSTVAVGVTGTTATASTVNIGTSSGATQTVNVGATSAGGAAAGTTVNIQGGTTANSAVVIGTSGAGGITMDTGTTGTINIGTSTANNAKTINIGPTQTKTSATTIQVGVNTAGTSTVHIGSATAGTAAAGTTVSIQGGTTANTAVVIGTNGNGGITVDSGTTGTVNIGNGANSKTVNVGSTSGTSTTNLQAGSGNMVINVGGTVRGTFANANALYLGNGVTAAAPNAFTLSGTGSATTAVAGGALTVQGGNATVGNANGGNVILSGGTGFGTGVKGLVVIDTPTITTASTQVCGSNCTVTQANVDSNGAVLINATAAGVTATLNDPTIQTAGKIMYVTNVGANDFTLSVNGGGTGNTIAMKPNTTATMIWSGVGGDWTAAGASSSTDLQSAYNNTLTSAGGAELVLNAPGGSADGLTIRNNSTNPIVGAILEAQTSVGSNLFAVNNNATEYANNGGAESSTFTMWTGAPAGGTISRYTTAGDNIATGSASVFVDTTSTANTGVRNTLASTLTANLKYRVSYTIRHTSSTTSFTTLDTIFSRDGTNTATTDCSTGQTATYGQWTRISCTFTAPSSGITASNAIFIRHSDAVEHDFYIDNLSVNVSADVNHAADGSVDSALGTNWTAYDADGGAGTSVLTRDTTVIYDTSGSVEADTSAHINEGMRNNMSITPQVSTQYLVSFYARSSNTFNDIRVGFLPAGGSGTPNAAQLCTDYNTQSISTTGWTKVTCLFTTPSSGISDPDLVIYQPTASDRDFYVDALSITLNTNNASNVQIGGGNKGGPATLFTLDRSNGAPIANNNDAYLGSMYYDTASGRIQCYEADGWGACGAAPDNIVNLNPEYAGAVLNGSGVGTMTADFCSNDTALTINSGLCSTGQAKNFYRWTSPQPSPQTYSIYVTYQLPATFNGFSSDDTVQLTARVDNTSNASVTYEMFKSTGSTVTQCGTGTTNIITGGGGTANTWYSYGINGNEATGCSFNSGSAGNLVIFKINLTANSNANAYVSTLTFTTTGR